MAYAVKYLFKFQSSNGTVREIRVLKDGYSGDVIQRPLGRAPVIKKEKNGGIHGTSLTFYAECHIDREYIEFYTSDPKEYRVDVYAGSTLLWQGYITPELYSEPDIAPPYDVQVVATDGVGELKLYDFAPQGTVTLRALLTYLLGYTGLTTDVNLVSSLKPGSRGAGALLDMQICVDYLAGKTCYEALTYILTTLHATITRWGGAWVLVRETNVTFTSDKVRYFNTSGNSALLTGSVQTLGAMRAAPAWPVGQLSTVIDPAKNKVVVQAPWHPVTCLQNPDMTSDASWAKSNGATYVTDGYQMPQTTPTPGITQTISMTGLRVPMSLRVRATGLSSLIGLSPIAWLGVVLTYTVGNVTYYLYKDDSGAPVWRPEAGGNLDFEKSLVTWNATEIEAEELSVENIPAFVQGNTFPAGTLAVNIGGFGIKVYSAYLDVTLPKGYADILRIDNGARGEGDTVEIAIGRVTSEVAYYQRFLQGLLLDSGSLITAFSDANFTTAMDYLALISRDYALSAALPRALAKGTVYLESSIGMPPLVFAKGGLNYWLETWSWDLYEDELEIDARTLPSASLTVQSETIQESDGSTVSSSSSGSSGGGSSSSLGGSVTYFEPHNDGIILKADYEYVSVPDVLLGEDEESLTSLLAIIAGNATQGAAAYGYFSDGVLGTSHLPALYLGTTQIQTSSAAQAVTGVTNLTMSGKLTIGGAEIEWVPAVGTTPGYLKINSALLTDGDQIVGGGTPGGGGGGGASYLSDLLDVKYGLNPSADDLLIYSSSVPLNPDGTITGPGWTTIAKSSVGKIYSAGTGLNISPSNVIGIASGYKLPTTTEWGNKADASALGNYVAKAGDTMTGALTFSQTSSTRRNGIIGTYDANRAAAIWSMGDSYQIAADGMTMGNLYGACYVYYGSGYTYGAGKSGGHSFVWCQNGSPTSALGNNVWTSGGFIKDGGTSSQFLKADGSVDSTAYLPLTGGTISSSSTTPLTINSSDTGGSSIILSTGGTNRGYVGYSSVGVYMQSVAVSGNPYVNIASDGDFKYKNAYPFYHSNNSNKSDVPWACSTLTTNGLITISGIGMTAIMQKKGTGTVFSLGSGSSGTTAGTEYGILSLFQNGTEMVRLYANSSNPSWINAGNVGIGTTSPSYKLEVSGTSGWTTRIISTNSGIYAAHDDGYGFYVGSKASSSSYYLFDIRYGQTNVGSGGTSAFYVRADGNVGIGTNSPEYMLDVNGEVYVNNYIWIGRGGTTIDSRTRAGATEKLHLQYYESGDLSLCHGGGNVGIGTTSPEYKLDVAGVVRASRFITGATDSGLAPYAGLSAGNQITSGLTINDGAIYYNGYKLWVWATEFRVHGTIVSTGDQTVSSDITLKENLAPVTYSVEDIAKTRAVTFDWKDGRGKSAGSIAQDWKPLIPELVHGEEGDMTLAYGQIALVNSILLARKSESHEERIKELEARVAELEMENERLRMN